MASSAAARQSYRVFVGNLPWTIGSTELRQFASSFGPVTYSNVVFCKKTGLSKGFGFVAFGTRDGFNAITKGSGGNNGAFFLEGHHLNINPANQQMNTPPGGMSGGSGDE